MDVCVIVKRCRPGLSRGWRICAECADVTRRMIADTAAATTKYLTDYYYIRKKSLSWEKIFDAENRHSLGCYCYSCRCWLAGWSELIGLYFESCQEYENIFVLGPKVIRSIRTHLFRINEGFIGAISVIYMGG